MAAAARILVVEDSPTQAIRLQDVLEQAGFQVECRERGKDALESLGQLAPDLVLLDYFLEDMRGDEFCRRVRMNLGSRGIPILMLTADDTRDAELRGLESGADDFVQKSIETDVLLLKIRNLLKGGAARGPVLEHESTSLTSTRVLTIDDSPTFLEYLNQELIGEGYSVAQASRPEEGLRLLAGSGFDGLLIDLVMPIMDGIEVCRRATLTAAPPTARW